MGITDQEYNLVLELTRVTHLDEVIDIAYDDKEDYFWDFEEQERLPLKEGFEIIAEAMAYPFEHEGFNSEESGILESLIKRFVPDFVAPSK